MGKWHLRQQVLTSCYLGFRGGGALSCSVFPCSWAGEQGTFFRCGAIDVFTVTASLQVVQIGYFKGL